MTVECSHWSREIPRHSVAAHLTKRCYEPGAKDSAAIVPKQSNASLEERKDMPSRQKKCSVHATPVVPSLETLCIRTYLSLLEVACSASDFENGKCSEMFQTECALIPWVLRQRLVEEVLKSGRLHDTSQILVLELLLNPDLRRLAVLHVRRWYRSRFLDLLASGRASGLRVLLIEDVTWFTGSPVTSAPLAAVFHSLPHLQQISLRFVCDDSILGSIGASCPLLQEIDTGGSIEVSDVGVQKMCIRANVWSKSASDPSRKKGIVNRAVKGAFLSCFLEDALNLQNSLPNWWRNSVIKRACKNPCCKTLRIVNFTATRVTNHGVQLVKSLAPCAEVRVNSQQ